MSTGSIWGIYASGMSAGSTTYVNSVQNITITIASGATTGTATISAVGANAFIIFGGLSTASTSNMATGLARITLTNSTTVTATRTTSTTSAITVKCAVIDATSSLVKSVQFGTISFTSVQSSNTATITAVNNNFSVVHLLGWSTGSTGTAFNNSEPQLSLSGTTVTAGKNTLGQTTVASYVVIEFQSAACQSNVQQLSTTWTTSSASTTQAISSVTTANSMIFTGGTTGNYSSSVTSLQRAALTNSTTVTLSVNNSTSVPVTWKGAVVEFVPGVLASSVQRGTITLTGVTSNTGSITTVGSKAAANWLGFSASAGTSLLNEAETNLTLTNTTTLTAAKNTATANTTVSYEVLDFN